MPNLISYDMTESTQTSCCCGTLAQQQKRVARFNELIETLSSANTGEARRVLHHAQQTKARIEKWIAVHSHAPARPMRTDAAWQAQVRVMTHSAGEGA